MKKIISLFMVCVFVMLALVACGGTEDKITETNAPSSGTETDEYDQLLFDSVVPKGLDFEGYELILYTSSTSPREWVKVDGYDAELDLAVENRNDQVEAELNVKLRVESEPGAESWDATNENVHTTILNDITTGHFYDMYAMPLCTNYLKLRGAQANLLDKEILPYFDFTKPCWTQSLVDFAVNGKMYFINGDLNTSAIDGTMVTWHNKDLYDRVKTDKDPEDIQDLALEGGFTYDVLYNWATLFQDAGTGQAHDNTYGLADMNYRVYDALPYMWDFKWIIKNADGTYAFNIIGNEKANNATEDLRILGDMKGVNTCLGGYLSNNCTAGESQAKHFAAGKFLFYMDLLGLGDENNMAIREMQNKYCVLPLPKYYEDQADYYTTVTTDCHITAVLNQPADVIRGEAISAFFQRATELSYTKIRAMYIKSIIEPRYFGSDDEDGTVSKSIATFEKIYQSVVYDAISVYGPQMERMHWLFRDMVEKDTRSLEETFKQNSNTWGLTITQQMYEDSLADWQNYMWAD